MSDLWTGELAAEFVLHSVPSIINTLWLLYTCISEPWTTRTTETKTQKNHRYNGAETQPASAVTYRLNAQVLRMEDPSDGGLSKQCTVVPSCTSFLAITLQFSRNPETLRFVCGLLGRDNSQQQPPAGK